MVAVAHQVEHRIVAPEVGGSRPLGHPTLVQPVLAVQPVLTRPTLIASRLNSSPLARLLRAGCRQLPAAQARALELKMRDGG